MSSDNCYYVYVLKCKTPNHFYIGYSKDFSDRLKMHCKGKGARFTKVHGFAGILKVIKVSTLKEAKETEKKWTLEFMKKFGRTNVAGGGYSQVFK